MRKFIEEKKREKMKITINVRALKKEKESHR